VLARPANKLYMNDFLRFLKRKIKAKQRIFPELSLEGFERLRNFKDYDDRYTAPLHGFDSAEDYWHKCSSKRFLADIAIPSIIINSLDDPFLGDLCFPHEEAHANPNVFLETPLRGGHVGFISLDPERFYWSERRTLQFVSEILGRSVEAQPARRVG
jgi:uncharacterized protein